MTSGNGSRILFDVTDLMPVMIDGGHMTGIARVVADCLAPLLESQANVVPVFFSRLSRAFCRVDGARLLARDVEYLKSLRPASGDHLRRLLAFAGPLRKARTIPDAQDTLLVLSAGWGQRQRHRFLFDRDRSPCRVVWFCHDLIPVLYPEFAMNAAAFSQAYELWLHAALQHGHEFICSSRFVAEDLRRYAASRGLSANVSVVPLAHEFKPTRGQVRADISSLAGRPFALCVSPIGLRKNQIALARAWERLHRELGDDLTTLVLAGDLIDPAEVDEFLRKTGNVGGKVMLLGPVTEAELTWLYERCTFTVFPSLNEGWGLPIGESLWMGKPCLSSSLTSLPEVGGSHVSYFDPRDEDDMLATLRKALRGEFLTPPPREKLRNWRQVADDLVGLIRR